MIHARLGLMVSQLVGHSSDPRERYLIFKIFSLLSIKLGCFTCRCFNLLGESPAQDDPYGNYQFCPSCDLRPRSSFGWTYGFSW